MQSLRPGTRAALGKHTTERRETLHGGLDLRLRRGRTKLEEGGADGLDDAGKALRPLKRALLEPFRRRLKPLKKLRKLLIECAHTLKITRRGEDAEQLGDLLQALHYYRACADALRCQPVRRFLAPERRGAADLEPSPGQARQEHRPLNVAALAKLGVAKDAFRSHRQFKAAVHQTSKERFREGSRPRHVPHTRLAAKQAQHPFGHVAS